MRVVHVCSSLTRQAGGIFEIQLSLAHHLTRAGVNCEAIGIDDAQWEKDAPRWPPVAASVCRPKGPAGFGYAPELTSRIFASHADVAHLHNLWMYSSIAANRWTKATRRPLIVSTNGMLEPWALQNSALKKKLAGIFYERGMLKSAACMQANTAKERDDILAFGLRNPICIIPNGVDLPELETADASGERRETGGERGNKEQRQILLFLGRLHPKKGLVNALKAWSALRRKTASRIADGEWCFAIAGWDQNGHQSELKRLCKDLDLDYRDVPASDFVRSGQQNREHHASVYFLGPAFGDTKASLFQKASAFVLPSFSEGLPMAVLEAWAHRLPVLMTDHCNLPEGFQSDAAIRSGTDVESIAAGLDELLTASKSERATVGLNGRRLVEANFTWPQVAAHMKGIYEWVLGLRDKPAWVID